MEEGNARDPAVEAEGEEAAEPEAAARRAQLNRVAQVWRSIVRAVHTSFRDRGREVERGIIGLIASTNNSLKETVLFVPSEVGCKAAGYQVLERKYTWYLKWLLGSFFSLLTHDRGEEVVERSLAIQTSIMQLLADKRGLIFLAVLEDYLNCVLELISLERNMLSLVLPSVLKAFSPGETTVVLDGESVVFGSIPLEVRSHADCVVMQTHALHVITEVVDELVMYSPTHARLLWDVVCSCLTNARDAVKVCAFKLSCRLIQISGFSSNVDVHSNYLSLVTELVQINPFHSKSASTAGRRAMYLAAMLEFVAAVRPLADGLARRDHDRLLPALAPVCSRERPGDGSEALLAAAGELVERLLGHARLACGRDDVARIVGNLDHYKEAMRIVEHNIVYELQLEQKPSTSPGVFRVQDSSETWSFLLPELQNQTEALSRTSGDGDVHLPALVERARTVQAVVVCAMRTALACKRRWPGCAALRFDFGIDVAGLSRAFLAAALRLPEDDALGVRFLRLVLDVVGNFLSMPDVYVGQSEATGKIDPKEEARIVDTLVGFLVLPWLTENMDTLGYLDVNRQLSVLAQQCRKHLLDTDLRVFCLSHLVRLPQDHPCQRWAWQLAGRCAEDEGSSLGPAVVRSLVTLPGDHPGRRELLEDVVRRAAASTNPGVHEALSEVIGRVVCLADSSCHTIRKMEGTRVVHEPRCAICDGPPETGGEKPSCRLDPALLTGDLTATLLSLIASPDPGARCHLARALPSLSNHVMLAGAGELARRWIRFVDDEDHRVRRTFAATAKYLVFNRRWMRDKRCELDSARDPYVPLTQHDRRELTGSMPLLRAVNGLLILSVRQSLQRCDKLRQETLMITVREIGCVPVDCVLLPSFSILMLLVGHHSSAMFLPAKECITIVAAAHNCKPVDLYIRYKAEICNMMVEIAIMNHVARGWNFSSVVRNMARAAGFAGSIDFISKEARTFLPRLFPALVTHGAAKSFLDDIVALLHTTTRALVIEHFPYIYARAFLFEPPEVLEACERYLEELAATSVEELKAACTKVMANELLLHFHARRERVLEGLRDLARCDPQFGSPTGHHMTEEEIADFLQPQFLGILVSFDNNFVLRVVSESTKRRALQSLPGLIRLMGAKHITPVRFNVLAMLRTALCLDHGDFPALSCAAWDAFVRSVQRDLLGPLLSTVFASLTPLLGQFPGEVGEIFRYLVEEDDRLCEHFSELYFVPPHPEIITTYDKIQRYITEHRPDTYEKQLRELRSFASHENVDVRIFGLKRLKGFLSSHRETYLQRAICQNERVDQEIADVLYTLIDGSKDPSPEVGLWCGECLGEIGAIDPGIVPRPVFHKGTDQFPLYVLAGDVFAYQAITTLARFYLSSRDTYNMDALSLAIQDMLKMYKLTTESVSSSELWRSFSQEVRELLTPLLTSRYKSTVAPENSWPDSATGTTFPEWTYRWASKLTSLITNKLIREMFFSCLLSFIRDFQVALYFLPYILLQALVVANDEAKEEIFEEVSSIVNGSRRGQGAVRRPRPAPDSRRGPAPSPDTQPGATCDREKSLKITKTVLTLVDFLKRWVREYNKSMIAKKKAAVAGGSALGELDYQNITGFLERLPMQRIACSNYECHEYQRALMYEEEHLSQHPDELQKEMSFLAKIYGRLDDADMVAGVLARRTTEPTLTELVLAHEVTGRLRDAAACYERLGSERDLSPGFVKGMVECYLGLDRPFFALRLTESITRRQPELAAAMVELEAECYWRMQSFDRLEELMASSPSPEGGAAMSWGVAVGQSLVAMRRDRPDALRLHLTEARRAIVNTLAVSSLERTAYQQGYPDLVRLHMLAELEKTSELVGVVLSGGEGEVAARALFAEWDARLEHLQYTARVAEPVLCMRRTLLALAKELIVPRAPELAGALDTEIGRYWIKSAELARKTQYFQEAQIYIMKADALCPKESFIEKAKQYWDTNQPQPAFGILRRGLDRHFPEHKTYRSSSPADITPENRKLCAEAMLLLAQYNDKSMSVDVNTNIKLFKDAVEMYRTEENIVCLAQYYERILGTFAEETRDWKGGNELHCHIIKEFGTSLQYGTNYIHQSMPKILTFWMDYVTRYSDLLSGAHAKKNAGPRVDGLTVNERINQMAVIAESMTHQIEKFSESLPPYMFMTAFSQILSRVCHPQKLVSRVVKRIIHKLMIAYPQHTLWMLIPSLKSTQEARRMVCQEILSDEKIRRTALNRVVLDFIRLCEKFIELADREIPDTSHQKKDNSLSVNKFLKTLPRLLSNKDFSRLMMPVEAMRTLVLPKATTEAELKAHDAFPNTMVYIEGIEDDMTVIKSLQKPRRITLRGSDGRLYPMMVKPKDDLRIDFRMMEFNHVVNRYLTNDPESLQRGLCIRTFSVVPLNEECGLIEWIPNLMGLRPILIKLYKERGIYERPEIQKKSHREVPLAKKRLEFQALLKSNPPLFKEWFRDTFIDACSWYLARTSYIRTTAVMSMVGYIMGLGDRHGENILFDTTNGETVHVDFNCLFNKGETFDVPEKVPFRLTHNMEVAMGPLGVDGTFRHCCEIALRVLQRQRETLVSVLRPFVYEPCAETEGGEASYSRPSTARNQRNRADESTNDQALTNIANIQSRLSGFIHANSKVYCLPLSVEGQVNHLILEATNIDNLCHMYVGWAPSY